MVRIGTSSFRTPAQRNRSIVSQMQAETERQRRQQQLEDQRLQREMQLEIQRQKLIDKEGDDRLGREFKVEQQRQRQLDSDRIPPTPEQRRDRQGRTFPDPALGPSSLDVMALRGQPTPDEGFDRNLELSFLRQFAGRIRRGETVEEAASGAQTAAQSVVKRPTPGFLDKALGVAGKVGGVIDFVTDPSQIIGRAGESFQPQTGITGRPSPDQLRRQALFATTAETLAPPSLTEIQETGALASRPLVGPALGGVAEVVEQVERPLGIEGVVSDKLRSQLAEDIATEVFNPVNIALVAPFAMQGTAGLTGIRLAEQIASNLLLTGLEPGLVRGTLRGFALLGTRGTAALKNLPKAVKETPIFQQALKNVREAGERGGPLRGGELPGGSIADTSDEAIHISKGDPGPPPPRKPKGATPDDPEFRNIQEVALKGEKPPETLIRRHQGAVDTAKREAANEVRDNNKTLVEIGLGRKFRGSVVAKEEGAFNELNSLLHNPSKVASGERVVPDELRPIYDKLRAQTDWEQAARIDFDPSQALVEDYFFRGWQPPEGMFIGEARGSLGRNPSFKLPRVDATYDEMVEAGFRPLFDNPAEQARYSQVMGIKYREQMRLIDDIKAKELALPVTGGPVPEGWRVPKVGPAFEGKPYADGTRVAFTRRWAVPDSLANRLENAYGVTPKLGKGEIFGKTVDFQKAVDAVTFTPKRFKLVGSLFQHIDFLSRSHIGAWTGFADATRRGQPATAVARLAKWPQSAVDIAHATFSPNFRARLAKLAVDDTPLFEGRKISNKMISEAGLSLRDETIFPELDAVIRQVEREPRIVRLGKAPLRALGDLERQWRQGLFDGVYPAAILSDIKNNIGPMIIKQHPEATDAQLAGMIAKAANEVYSTIPASMSVIQNRQARWFLTRFLFSLGENEGLLRSFTGAIRGENAAFFRTRLAGTYLGLMALATTIHFASTGKPLPLNRFTPVSKDKWGPLPVGYNTDFASPDLPIKGRGGANIQLDLVMQQDTIFRVLDPKSFLSSRTSVPVRAIENQRTGKDFFGAPIDTVGPGGIFSRTAQLAQDLFAPIGPGQAGLQILRNNIEETEGLIQPAESRLGTAGVGIQSAGINLRAERTPELLDRIRGEVLRDRGIEDSYTVIAAEDLPLKAEIDTEVEERIGGELEIRGETSKLRGQQTPQSEGFEALEATRERQQVEQLSDDANLNSGQWDGEVWRGKYADRQRDVFTSSEQIKEDFQITFDDRQSPPKSVNAAIDAYFDVNVDEFSLPDGTVDWDGFFNARETALRPLSTTDRNRVTTWLRKFDTPTVMEFRKAQDVVDRLFEIPKYIGLNLKQGEEVDRVLNEVVPRLQLAYQRETNQELERGQAMFAAAELISDPEVARFLLTNFGPRLSVRQRRRTGRRVSLGRPDVVNPERDALLLEKQEILAKFYPDILQRQLNREQEAGLGEEAFAAVAR